MFDQLRPAHCRAAGTTEQPPPSAGRRHRLPPVSPQHYFLIVFGHDGQKPLELRTEEESECDEWVEAIQQARYATQCLVSFSTSADSRVENTRVKFKALSPSPSALGQGLQSPDCSWVECAEYFPKETNKLNY